MGKNESFGPPKVKPKGLGKLKFYCQMCEKQCKDANGFKCHATSEGHQQVMMLFANNPDKYIGSYSQDFLRDFVQLLSTRFGTTKVLANIVYQEYISDKNHLHMNSTRWSSLSVFAQFLGRSGIAEVEESEKGWWITWIDNSAKSVAAKKAKKERNYEDDERKITQFIEQQIENAKKLIQEDHQDMLSELKRGEEEKIKIEIKAPTFAKKPTLEGFAQETHVDDVVTTKKKNLLMYSLIENEIEAKKSKHISDSWLVVGITLKIVDRKSIFYGKKGKVEAVLEYRADLKLLENDEYVRVDMRQLETVIPISFHRFIFRVVDYLISPCKILGEV